MESGLQEKSGSINKKETSSHSSSLKSKHKNERFAKSCHLRIREEKSQHVQSVHPHPVFRGVTGARGGLGTPQELLQNKRQHGASAAIATAAATSHCTATTTAAAACRGGGAVTAAARAA